MKFSAAPAAALAAILVSSICRVANAFWPAYNTYPIASSYKPVQATRGRQLLHALSSDSRDGEERGNMLSEDRRKAISNLIAAPLLPFVAVAHPAKAAGDGPTSAVSPQELLARLRRVPTFTIVKDGVPYMIVDKGSRGATGYFFLTFRGAMTVLSDAQRVAEEGGYAPVWKDATITVVPLDIALRLSLKKIERKGQNDVAVETIADIIPGVDERDDALSLDRSGKYNEQGRVPLFYVEEGMEVPPEEGSSTGSMLPVYFSKSDLLNDWARLYPGKNAPPQVKVMDLLDVFQDTLRGKNDKNVVFSPSEETMKVAVELKSRERGSASYKTDTMIMVGGK